MTADLERRLRALRDELPEPPTTIDPAALHPVEEIVPADDLPSRPRRSRWVVAVLVAAALVVGVVVAVQVVRDRHVDRGAPMSTTPPSPRIDPATQLVHDGDRVAGNGQVIAVDGGPVLFCAPEAFGLGQTNGTFDPRDECPDHVEVTGVDVTKLDDLTRFADGVYGRAHLVGTYEQGRLTDVVQSSFEVPTDQLPQPPCAPPAGGWLRGAADDNPDAGPVSRYQAAHPGEILTFALLRPSDTQAVWFVLTAGDPAPVAAALRPDLGDSLCVVRSTYSQAQLDAAAKVFDLSSPLARAARVWSLGPASFMPDGQLFVEVDLPFVTQAAVAAAQGQPAGLVQFVPWLSPVS